MSTNDTTRATASNGETPGAGTGEHKVLRMTRAGRLRISASIWQRLRSHHLAQGKTTEAISVVLGHQHRGPDGALTIILAREEGLLLFAPDCYERRSYGAAVLRRDVRAQVLWRAVTEGWTAVVDVHDHHLARLARFSDIDDCDDLATAHYFASTLPQHARKVLVAAALLLARDDARARFVGGDAGLPWGEPLRIDVVGLHGLQTPGLATQGCDGACTDVRHARQAAIVPTDVQARLAEINVAVAGCGGTGSIAAEALARLGVGRITLIDADRIEAHNLNRLQGCGTEDQGLPKAEVLARHIGRAVPGIKVDAVCGVVHEGAGRAAVSAADVVFGCLDNAETRWWLNRVAVQMLQPYFDVGVVVERGDEPRMLGRVNTIMPGAGPCGHCSPIEFFPRQRPTTFLDEHTLRVQREAGYVEGSSTQTSAGDPSLYGLNLQAVGSLMQEFVQWACGRPVAHAVVHAVLQGMVQRLPLHKFGGAVAADCPVCSTLLGMATSVDMPSPGSAAPADVQGDATPVDAALAATFDELRACQ
jgi:molybdopterin/thiamine biosynthesis adenylyltransferase